MVNENVEITKKIGNNSIKVIFSDGVHLSYLLSNDASNLNAVLKRKLFEQIEFVRIGKI